MIDLCMQDGRSKQNVDSVEMLICPKDGSAMQAT